MLIKLLGEYICFGLPDTRYVENLMFNKDNMSDRFVVTLVCKISLLNKGSTYFFQNKNKETKKNLFSEKKNINNLFTH